MPHLLYIPERARMSISFAAVPILLIACSSSGSSSSAGGSATAGTAGAAASTSTGGASSGGTGGSKQSSGGTGATAGTVATGGSAGSIVVGGPGCGLDSAAFCDTFDAPSAVRGRAGDLNPKFWSASRGNPQLATGNGASIAAGPATLRACRSDLPAKVFPSDDAAICDPIPTIKSNHLLVAVGSQNYGQNSYRIRQPFDFAGRTGKIVFDAQGFLYNPLLGWISLAVTEDPDPIPGYAIGSPGQTNDDGTAAPRSGFEVHFSDHCPGSVPTKFGLRMIDVFDDYKNNLFQPTSSTCTPSAIDQLNHFEIDVSQTNIKVYASPVSSDGVTFGAQQLMLSADVNLKFTRGYVTITTHNHATLKYSGPGSGFGSDVKLDAWISRWDNVGFDGPVLANWREYEIPDSLIPGNGAWNISGPTMNYGYIVADVANGPSQKFKFAGVDLTGVTAARIAVGSWYNAGGNAVDQFDLQYRLNGHAWHDRKLTASEIALLTNGHSQGALAQILDVPLSDLVAGDNTLEFVTVNVPHNYPPAVSAIDLVLSR